MKRIRILIFAAVLALALPTVAMAESFTGQKDWTVTFNQSEKMVDNYSADQWADDIRQLQPGDDITFTVTCKHEHSTACDWYMANEVLKSLEEAYAAGSAYTYKLTYTNPAGKTRTLYDSEAVGGDRTNGLLDATSALEDFFYLDNLNKGETAHVDLHVSMDGETEGNAYFDTLAQLKMKFAVELNSNPDNPSKSTSTSSRRGTVQTGDDTNLFPFFVAMAVSGALLMLLGLYGVRQRKQDREEA
jgi:plastocyanin